MLHLHSSDPECPPKVQTAPIDPAETLSSNNSPIISGQPSAKRHICLIMCGRFLRTRQQWQSDVKRIDIFKRPLRPFFQRKTNSCSSVKHKSYCNWIKALIARCTLVKLHKVNQLQLSRAWLCTSFVVQERAVKSNWLLVEDLLMHPSVGEKPQHVAQRL